MLNEREKPIGVSDETRVKLVSTIKRKQEQVTRIVTAIADAGHNPALVAKLIQIDAEVGSLRTELNQLDAADSPAPLEITDEMDALIQAAARNIERVISDGVHPDARRLGEKIRGMIERITISRHESVAIEVGMRGAFAGVMQAAGLVERHSLDEVLKNDEALRCFRTGGLSIVGCGGRI